MTYAPAPHPIYLDHHATTPVDPAVIDAMVDAMHRLVGNPNSVEHAAGRRAAAAIKDARGAVSRLIGCEAQRLWFTASASAALRTALELAVRRRAEARPRVATTRVEHPAMLAALRDLEAQELVAIAWLDVDGRGQIVAGAVEAMLEEGVDILCLMMANNEVGTVYPAAAVAAQCLTAGVTTIVDATQAAGFLDLHPVALACDYLILSGHKIHGPKGVGALFAAEADADIELAFAHSGTPDVPAIVGMGVAADLVFDARLTAPGELRGLRDRLQNGLKSELDFMVVNGDLDARLPHSLHISLPGVSNDAMLARIGHEVAFSTGAACASGTQEPSHVLRAMGLPEQLVDSALRMSVGRFTTEAEIDAAVQIIARAARAILEAREEKVEC